MFSVVHEHDVPNLKPIQHLHTTYTLFTPATAGASSPDIFWIYTFRVFFLLVQTFTFISNRVLLLVFE